MQQPTANLDVNVKELPNIIDNLRTEIVKAAECGQIFRQYIRNIKTMETAPESGYIPGENGNDLLQTLTIAVRELKEINNNNAHLIDHLQSFM